jgi:hypothetical protein
MVNTAAHWLYNGREPRPFAAYVLHWQGRQAEYPRRMVHGRRPTTEQTVLDDVATILRETPASNITLKGWLHKDGHSTKTIAWWNRNHWWAGSEKRWGAITWDYASYLTQAPPKPPKPILDSAPSVTHTASNMKTQVLAERTFKALKLLSDAIDAIDEAHDASEPGTDLGGALEYAAGETRRIRRELDQKARSLP